MQQPDSEKRKQRNSRKQIEGLKRELNRLEREIDEGKHRGKKEAEAMKRAKTLTQEIRAHVPVKIKVEATPELDLEVSISIRQILDSGNMFCIILSTFCVPVPE